MFLNINLSSKFSFNWLATFTLSKSLSRAIIFVFLKSEFENVSLEYDYLSSAERLIEYQTQYFEDELIQKNIKDIKIYNISENINKIKNYKIIKE